ncbi:MAG: hypothetical protein M1288_04480 [Actinobacteria bacterium]|jgi:hypothetical protein|nr:hypothetical protein [Actinomycetota bacterium]
MNGYVEAGYLVVLGTLGGYSATLAGRSKKMRKALIPAKVEDQNKSRPND